MALPPFADGPAGATPITAAVLNDMRTDIANGLGVPDAALAGRINTVAGEARGALDALYAPVQPRLGTAENPVTSATAVRPSGITSVWWLTATQPANWVAGDIWVVTP